MGNDTENQEYLTIDEAAELIGWNRATVYDWVRRLQMKTHKFIGNRRAFITRSDAERIKAIKEKPWLAGEKGDDAA